MWNIIQCSTQGRGYEQSGIPCQDKTFSLINKQVTAAALADGAGSAALSHFGAETVTRHICTELCENFDEFFDENDGIKIKYYIIDSIQNCLNKKADELSCSSNDLASTLLSVAIKGNKCILIHIGDGIIGYNNDEALKIASEPINGEFTNTTVFTTSKDVLTTMKLIKVNINIIDSFILMSDGTAASLYNKKEKHLSDSLKKVIELSRTVSTSIIQTQLQQSFDEVIRFTTFDDCSMIMLIKDNKKLSNYRCLTYDKKCELLGFDPLISSELIRQYDSILVYSKEKKTSKQIAKHLRLKQSIANRRIHRLCNLSFLDEKDGYYQTTIRFKSDAD